MVPQIILFCILEKDTKYESALYMTVFVICIIYNSAILTTKRSQIMAYRSYSRSSSRSSSSSKGYSKSYNNSTRQTCAQRKSPTKTSSGWHDAGGGKVHNKSAYFSTIDSNGKNWESC